jgi:hypothetical protein
MGGSGGFAPMGALRKGNSKGNRRSLRDDKQRDKHGKRKRKRNGKGKRKGNGKREKGRA